MQVKKITPKTILPSAAVTRSPSDVETLNSTPKTTPGQAKLTNEKKKGKKVGEVVGGAAAEFTAVCCCCPFTLMDMLILAVYRVPTGLCRRAWRKRMRQRRKRRKGLLAGDLSVGKCQEGSNWPAGLDVEAEMKLVAENLNADAGDCDGANEAVDLDKEMWDRFYGTGFWRSPSQRDQSW